jgi:hypothetical protein
MLNLSDFCEVHGGPLIDPYRPKKILNFRLEEMLDHHFNRKFGGEYVGDSPETQKLLYLDPLNDQVILQWRNVAKLGETRC